MSKNLLKFHPDSLNHKSQLDQSLDFKSYVIHIKNLCLEWSIGVYDNERRTKQLLIMDISLEAFVNGDWRKDQYNQVACYDKIVQQITLKSQQGHIALLETLANEVANICLEDHHILSTTVLINKPEAMMGRSSLGDTMIAVEVFKRRDDLK